MVFRSMLGGIWNNFIDFVTGIFALIPQFLYFIYTCCASALDAIQYAMRKLAGLDTYYVNGTETNGDIVYNFITGILGINGSEKYSALTTVFWSLIIFGVILLVLSTIFAIIRSHYTGDVSKMNPFDIIRSSVKTLFTMAIIPIVSVFGIYLANILLKTLDEITSPASISQIEEVYKNSSKNYQEFFEEGKTSTGEKAYASYDFFSFGSYTNSATFSGTMFKICASSANRVRNESYTASESTTKQEGAILYAGLWSDLGIFTSKATNADDRKEEVAEMIDTAFAYNLTTKDKQTASLRGKESWSLLSSYTYLESAVWFAGTVNFQSFSKYNVGLVWYYYNLWSFNYFIGFAGMAFAITFLSSVMFGLIVRMLEILALFLVFPPLAGLGPLDGNKAIGEWKKKFISDVLMGYGAVVGLNLLFILLNEVDKITFFKSWLLNDLMTMLIILAALAVLKDIVKLISGFVGGGDALATGEKAKGEVKQLATQAASKAIKVAKVGVKIMSVAVPAMKVLDKGLKKLDEVKKKIQAKTQKAGMSKLQTQLADAKIGKKDAGDNAGKEEKISEAESAEFDAILAHAEDGDFDADTGVDTLSDKYNDDSAKAIFGDYKEQYTAKMAEIDSDSSLSDEEKVEKKNSAAKSLKSEASSKFRKGNSHAVRAEGFRQTEIEQADIIFNTQEDIEAIKSGKKSFDKEGNISDKPRGVLKNAMLDMSGRTIKLVGTITGLSGAKKALEEAGIIDDSKEFIQEVYRSIGQAGPRKKNDDDRNNYFKDELGYFTSGNSILSTKKQKENLEKSKAEYFALKKKQLASESERQTKEIEKLASVLVPYMTAKKDIRNEIANNKKLQAGLQGNFDPEINPNARSGKMPPVYEDIIKAFNKKVSEALGTKKLPNNISEMSPEHKKIIDKIYDDFTKTNEYKNHKNGSLGEKAKTFVNANINRYISLFKGDEEQKEENTESQNNVAQNNTTQGNNTTSTSNKTTSIKFSGKNGNKGRKH